MFSASKDFLFLFDRGTHMNNQNKGKWFKFNDTVVEEFEMNEAALEAECFGGTYKTKVYDTCKYISTKMASQQRYLFVPTLQIMSSLLV